MATFYFNNAVDHDWYTLGNWWTDEACTVQATFLPRCLAQNNPADSIVVGEGIILDLIPGNENGSYGINVTNSGIIGRIGAFCGHLLNNATGVIADVDDENWVNDNYGIIGLLEASCTNNYGWVGLMIAYGKVENNYGTVVTSSTVPEPYPLYFGTVVSGNPMLYDHTSGVRVAFSVTGSGNWAVAATWLASVVPAYATNGYRAYIAPGMTVDEVPEGEICVENLGTVTTNNGTVDWNQKSAIEGWGAVGTITTNGEDGTVTLNNGDVLTNDGLIVTNAAAPDPETIPLYSVGSVDENNGEITTNNGDVGVNN